MKLFKKTGKCVKTTLFAAKSACLDTVLMIRHNKMKYQANLIAFKKNFANYQLAPLIDNLRSFFQTAQNWSTTKVGHCVSVKHYTVRSIVIKSTPSNNFCRCLRGDLQSPHVLGLKYEIAQNNGQTRENYFICR